LKDPTKDREAEFILEYIENFFEVGTWIARYRKLWALSIRPNIPVCISGNFRWPMDQHFPQFPEKRTTSGAIPKYLKISYREFLFHLIFIPEFPEFSVEWLKFRKFNNFRIFRKLSKEISVPFALVPTSSGLHFGK